jgi:adenylate kinase
MVLRAMPWNLWGEKKSIFLICGVPAAGKSTVCEIAAEREKWSVLNFADEMLEFKRQEDPEFSRADLHGLMVEERKALQGSTLHEIKKKLNRGHPTLIQSHVVVEFKENIFIPGLILDENIANLHVKGVFVLESRAEDIVERRTQNAKYAGYSKDSAFIAQHMQYTNMAALGLAFKASCPFAIIPNPQWKNPGEIHPAASELVDHINSILLQPNQR